MERGEREGSKCTYNDLLTVLTVSSLQTSVTKYAWNVKENVLRRLS